MNQTAGAIDPNNGQTVTLELMPILPWKGPNDRYRLRRDGQEVTFTVVRAGVPGVHLRWQWFDGRTWELHFGDRGSSAQLYRDGQPIYARTGFKIRGLDAIARWEPEETADGDYIPFNAREHFGLPRQMTYEHDEQHPLAAYTYRWFWQTSILSCHQRYEHLLPAICGDLLSQMEPVVLTDQIV